MPAGKPMALDEIKRNIEEQAKREADAIRKAAAEERDSIVREAEARLKELNQKLSAGINEELKRLREENESGIELSMKDIPLAAREEALSEEIPKVRKLLLKQLRASKHYEKLFNAAVKQAESFAPVSELVVEVDRLDKRLVEELGAKVVFKDMDGGLVVRSKNGDVGIDATLGGIIDSRMEEVKNAVLGELFGARAARAAVARKAAGKGRTSKRKK